MWMLLSTLDLQLRSLRASSDATPLFKAQGLTINLLDAGF